ncbi:MAG: FAD-dependent oxidoreductase [Leptospiraceae bacterium]|nr:FAD-dependent oxidoreductase [Leptospiraceae bacterium]
MRSGPVLIIIGNGITGITAARYARQHHPQMRIRVISDESDYFFSRTALMYIFMGHMRLQDTEPYERGFYATNGIELLRARVVAIDPLQRSVRLDSNQSLEYDYLLIACGSRPRYFDWPGQDLNGVQGLYSLSDLKTLEDRFRGSRMQSAVIVGGGLIGIEMAEMLHSRNVAVQMLVRESGYWGNVLPAAESRLIEREIQRHGIQLHLQTGLQSIAAHLEDPDRVGAVITTTGQRLPCDFVGITAGVEPRLDCVDASGLAIDGGILVDPYQRTSAERVFAAGDCARLCDGGGNPAAIEQLWYTGRMQGQVAGRQIAALAWRDAGETGRVDQIDTSPYQRGFGFNSAKFFTREFHTYGQVPPEPESQQTWVWLSADMTRLLRLYWQVKADRTVLSGVNAIGIRLRHAVFDDWLGAGLAVPTVIHRLDQAIFEPEFGSGVVRLIQRSWYASRQQMADPLTAPEARYG